MQVLHLRADAQHRLGSLIWRRRSQNPMELPSALRWALGLVASIMESMSRSKISGWKTSSTRRRFLSTMTWRPHSCAVVGIGKPQVCTVLDTCLRVAGSTLRSSSTTRWYALTASSSEYREASYQAVSCAPMVYSPSSPARYSFWAHSSILSAMEWADCLARRTCVVGCVGRTAICARFWMVWYADTPHSC